jgi:hypothetical protein
MFGFFGISDVLFAAADVLPVRWRFGAARRVIFGM